MQIMRTFLVRNRLKKKLYFVSRVVQWVQGQMSLPPLPRCIPNCSRRLSPSVSEVKYNNNKQLCSVPGSAHEQGTIFSLVTPHPGPVLQDTSQGFIKQGYTSMNSICTYLLVTVFTSLSTLVIQTKKGFTVWQSLFYTLDIFIKHLTDFWLRQQTSLYIAI